MTPKDQTQLPIGEAVRSARQIREAVERCVCGEPSLPGSTRRA